MLAIFNLIPIPPLDGSARCCSGSSRRRQAWQIRPFLAQYGIFIVLGCRAPRRAGSSSSFIFGVANFLVGGVRRASSGRTSRPA